MKPLGTIAALIAKVEEQVQLGSTVAIVYESKAPMMSHELWRNAALDYIKSLPYIYGCYFAEPCDLDGEWMFVCYIDRKIYCDYKREDRNTTCHAFEECDEALAELGDAVQKHFTQDFGFMINRGFFSGAVMGIGIGLAIGALIT